MFGKNKISQKGEDINLTCLNDLINLYYPDIFQYCLWHTANRQTAEDAVQETFLKMIKYFEKYINHKKFKSYIYKVAKNVCIDIWRRRHETETFLEDLPYIEFGFKQVECDMNLQYLVKILPQKYKEVLLLRFAQDLSIREIAEIQNIPLRTVQSRLRAALKQIKKSMKEGNK